MAPTEAAPMLLATSTSAKFSGRLLPSWSLNFFSLQTANAKSAATNSTLFVGYIDGNTGDNPLGSGPPASAPAKAEPTRPAPPASAVYLGHLCALERATSKGKETLLQAAYKGLLTKSISSQPSVSFGLLAISSISLDLNLIHNKSKNISKELLSATTMLKIGVDSLKALPMASLGDTQPTKLDDIGAAPETIAPLFYLKHLAALDQEFANHSNEILLVAYHEILIKAINSEVEENKYPAAVTTTADAISKRNKQFVRG